MYLFNNKRETGIYKLTGITVKNIKNFLTLNNKVNILKKVIVIKKVNIVKATVNNRPKLHPSDFCIHCM